MSLVLWSALNASFMVGCAFIPTTGAAMRRLGIEVPTWARIAMILVRWPFLASIIVYPILEILLGGGGIGAGLLTCLYLWIWYHHYKDRDDDDDWKRKKKELATKVKELAGKLVVVPAPAPA